MTPYASNTGTVRNLAALRAHDWRILLTPAHPTPRTGLRFAIDNGAWAAYASGTPFRADLFTALVERVGALADFVIIPDIVAGGKKSLEFSCSWLPYLQSLRLLLLPVQDGMRLKTVGDLLRGHPNIGIFLGGSTEWKLRTMYGWGMVAHSLGRHYHVGRVNTRRRIRLAAECGAHSFDGTSATRFSCTLPLLDSARRQCVLFSASASAPALIP